MDMFWGILLIAVFDIWVGLGLYNLFSKEEIFVRISKLKRPYRIMLRWLFVIFWAPCLVGSILVGVAVAVWKWLFYTFE